MAAVANRPPIPVGYDQPKSPPQQQQTSSAVTRSRASSKASHSAGAGILQSPIQSIDQQLVEPMDLPALTTLVSASQVRSQYPADSTENHVEYILVASFDIDRGSVMEHQYPGPISGDETMLAELMLPDQTHMRSQDWTVFFLHKDTTADEEAREKRRERRRRRRRKLEGLDTDEDGERSRSSLDGEDDEEDLDDLEDTDDEEEEDDMDGPPLVYVLNLVYTKHDTSVKRGAVVKAMAICTRHSFLHIYKPLLLLALEEYFKNPVAETLGALYDAVNSMDLSLLPRLSLLERHILQASDAKNMFMEKFEQMVQRREAEDAQKRASDHSDTSDAKQQRLQRYTLPRDTHEFESRVMYNSIPIPIKIPSAISAETVGDFSFIKLIQTFSGPHTQSPQAFSPTHPHLTSAGPNTHPITVLVNALLTQKRIVFLGHNQPSGSVAEAVLAACALGSGGGILRGFTRHAFPYTDLTKIDDLLKVPGFIAGVTNPAFAHKPEWWDLLCDLPTGRMKISPKIEGAQPTDGLVFFQQSSMGGSLSDKDGKPSGVLSTNGSFGNGKDILGGGGGHGGGLLPDKASKGSGDDVTGDGSFVESVLHSINSRHGEGVIRAKFSSYIQRFTRIAASFEECVYGASALYVGAHETDADRWGYGVSGHGYVWRSEAERAAVLGGYAWRVEGWRSTRSYYTFVADLAKVWGRATEADGDDATTKPANGDNNDSTTSLTRAATHGGPRREIVMRGIDLRFQCDRLRCLKLGPDQSAAIYLALARAVERAGLEPGAVPADAIGADQEIRSPISSAGLDGALGPPPPTLSPATEQARYDAINQLLVVLPESSGGLFHVALGLFHPRPDVRAAVTGLLDRIRLHPAGRHFWEGMGRFAKTGFWRAKEALALTASRQSPDSALSPVGAGLDSVMLGGATSMPLR